MRDIGLLLSVNSPAIIDITSGCKTVRTVVPLTIFDQDPLLAWLPIAVPTAIKAAVPIGYSRFQSTRDHRAHIVRSLINVIEFVTAGSSTIFNWLRRSTVSASSSFSKRGYSGGFGTFLVSSSSVSFSPVSPVAARRASSSEMVSQFWSSVATFRAASSAAVNVFTAGSKIVFDYFLARVIKQLGSMSISVRP